MFPLQEYKKEKIYLVLLLLAAALVRVYHIQFGKPFLYHADEIKLVAQAGRLLASRFMDCDVYFAIGTYPPFFTYLLTIPFALYIVVNLFSGRFASLADAKQFYDLVPFDFFLIGRMLVALMGVLSVYVLYRIVVRLYSKRLAWIASGLLAINFVHVQHSHYSTVDLPASLFALLAIYFAVLLSEKPQTKYYLACGVFAAMATATKFSLLFALVPALYGHFYHSLKNGLTWKNFFNKKLFLLMLVVVLGFVLFCPLFLLDFHKARQGSVEIGQFEKDGKLGSGGSLFSYWTGDHSEAFGVFYPNDLPHTFGLVLMAFTLIGLAVQIRRHQRADLLVLSFTLLTFIMLEYITYKALRHLLPVIPFFMLAAAIGIDELCRRVFTSESRRNAAVLGIMMGLCAIQAQKNYTYFNELAKKDPRTSAREWILQTLPDRSRIMTESFPPVLPNFYDPKSNETIRFRLSSLKLTSRRLNLNDGFISTLRDSSVDYYIADGFTRAFFDWKYSYKKYPEVVRERRQFFAWLEANAERLQTFKPDDPHIQPEIVIYHLRPPLPSPYQNVPKIRMQK